MIYDCFLFFNELDLLEIRLNELDEIVDYFVIIEGQNTFQNKLKPLYYSENKDRYAKFSHKIINIILTKDELSSNNPWDNERTSFNACLNIPNLKDDDIIILSSLDEIPKSSVLKQAVNHTPCHIKMDFCYFYLNTKFFQGSSDKWDASIIYTVKQLRNADRDVRDLFEKKTTNIFEGGWHFSFLGDAKLAVEKVNSYSHMEYNNLDEKFYQDKINNLIDPFNRTEFSKFSSFLEIKDLPIYIQDNIKKFEKYIR